MSTGDSSSYTTIEDVEKIKCWSYEELQKAYLQLLRVSRMKTALIQFMEKPKRRCNERLTNP